MALSKRGAKRAKLADILVMLEYHYVVDLILDSAWIILVFCCNFAQLELFFWTLHVFKMFYSRMNKPNIYNNIISISSFQNRVNDLINSIGFYFKMKVMECSHKGKNSVFLVFGRSFSKCIFLVIQWTPFFSGSTYV